MTEVIPVVLAINPAMMSTHQMVPRLFENGEELEIELPTDQLTKFAQATAILAAKLKIVKMLGLSDDVRERLLARLVPASNTNLPLEGQRHG